MTSHPNVVRLRVGEQHPVRLAGLGAAGYRWAPEVVSDEAVAEVDPAGTEKPESDAAGASGTELFTIRAMRPGVTHLRFAQRRPWEPNDRPPAKEHLIELHVTDR
jgi:predicted secreted protein